MEEREMDWKRLVQFALQGSSDLEQYAILLIRVSIGLFFAISGANKLFVAGGTNLFTTRSLRPRPRFPGNWPISSRVSSSFVGPY